MPPKAQTSMEFLVLTIFLLLMFAAFYVHLQDRRIEAMNSMVNAEALLVAEKAAYELNMAAAQGDGYSKEFTLPSMLYETFNYSISAEKNFVFVEYGNNTRAARIVVDNVTGTLKKGKNFIWNSGGIIYVS